MCRFRSAVGGVVLVLGLPVASALVHGQEAKPTVIKDGKLDQITLRVAKLPAGADVPVLVRRFSSDAADLGSGGEGGKKDRMVEAQKIQKDGPEILATEFVGRLLKLGSFTKVSVLETDAAVPPEAIVIEGKFLKIDPGSRAARYFVGFGAGKSTVSVEGAVKDGSGRTLAEFSQRRFGSMGMAGGDSLEKLTSDTKSIGKDIAEFLDAWARGKSLK